MLKLVLDADGTIKLAKSGTLEVLTSTEKCFMASAAYEEVIKGKEKMYEDAFIVESLEQKGQIILKKSEEKQIGSTSSGESATLSLFKTLKGDAIISDDRKFLKSLEEDRISFIIPTDVIVLLAKKRAISETDAKIALDNIRDIVRDENYQSAIENIKGE